MTLEANVFHDSFKYNPDSSDPRYNTENGVYKPGCGLENVVMSWGHDEYMYQVCKNNNSTLPVQALYMIRYFSLLMKVSRVGKEYKKWKEKG